jgi:chorismate mutase/prephenate dehydratase
LRDKIEDRRRQIDAVDDELLRLVNERARLAVEVGEIKRRSESPLHDRNREREVLSRVTGANPGPLSEQSVAKIFQCVIDEIRLRQSKVFHAPLPGPAGVEDGGGDAPPPRYARVAFQGEPGAFSEEAVVELLGGGVEPVPRPTFESLFAALDDGAADALMVPLENSLMGSVYRCYDLMLESPLYIVAEVIRHIAHHLIGCEGASVETVRVVESHPAALAQCERFFSEHPWVARVPADDTAASVRRVVEGGDPTRAAIAGRRAAALYGGAVLREHLEDHEENYTRFVLLSRGPEASMKGDKVSLAIRLAHRPGALHHALEPFAAHGVELLKIESRPIRGRPWQYRFYLDLQTPADESDLRRAFADLQERAEEVRFLGRYAAARTPAGL